MKLSGLHNKREVYSWALYDWANSAFATTIMAGFFPIFYKQYWREGVAATKSTFELGMYNSISGLLVALTAPFLGAVADKVGRKKVFLGFFAFFGILTTALLYVCGQHMWALAGTFYVCGTFGFLAANIFYDSLLIDVSGNKRTDFISALGFSLGYLGGGVLFAINVWMTLKPELFGIASKGDAVRLSFLTVAAWWTLFALPLFLWVREVPVTGERKSIGEAVSAGRREIMTTFRDIRLHRNIFLFLIAYWLYIDGVDTIIKMAVDYGVALGLAADKLIVALLITQFVGFPAAIAFGKIGERVGTKRGIYIGILIYVCVTIYGAFMNSEKEFMAMAVAIGLVQGGVQSLSRSFFSRLIPPGKAGEYFGFYNMLGKFATLIGPMLVGGVARLTGSSRLSLISLIILFAAGAFVLTKVKEVPDASLED